MYICCVKMHLLFILLSLKIHKKQIILKRTIYLKKVFFCLSAGLISSIIVSEGELVASSVFSPPNRILQVCIRKQLLAKLGSSSLNSCQWFYRTIHRAARPQLSAAKKLLYKNKRNDVRVEGEKTEPPTKDLTTKKDCSCLMQQNAKVTK